MVEAYHVLPGNDSHNPPIYVNNAHVSPSQPAEHVMHLMNFHAHIDTWRCSINMHVKIDHLQ